MAGMSPLSCAGSAKMPVPPRIRSFEMKDWFGQDIAWQGAMVAAGTRELFVRGQTGSTLDGKRMAGTGRGYQDAAAQARRPPEFTGR